MPKIDTALIGIGYWGSKLRRYIEQNESFSLKYICNSKSDLNEVWNDKEITAVVVATRNDTHYSMAKSALLSGKNILTEKKPKLIHIAEKLVAHETLEGEELEAVFNEPIPASSSEAT